MHTASPSGGALVGLIGFTRALAAAGLPVAPDATAAFVTAVTELDLADPGHLYWAGRATLCHNPDDLARYDLAFESWFGGTVPTHPAVTAEPQPKLSHIAALAEAATAGSDEAAPDLQVAADETEVLRHRDIAELTPAERAHLDELIATLRPRPPMRAGLRAMISLRESLFDWGLLRCVGFC